MTGPAELNITVYQGANFYLPFTVKDLNKAVYPITGATIRAKVRNDVDDAVPFLTFVCNVVDGPNGEGEITASAAVTAALVLPASAEKKRPLTKKLWDCEIEFSDGYVQRLVQGFCFFSPEVTK